MRNWFDPFNFFAPMLFDESDADVVLKAAADDIWEAILVDGCPDSSDYLHLGYLHSIGN